MAEQSGVKEAGVRVRVYLSHENDTLRTCAAGAIAQGLEKGLGMKGSSIQAQTGRWDGKEEPGFVVEIVYVGPADQDLVVATVRDWVAYSRGEVTCYVTIENVWAMEIF